MEHYYLSCPVCHGKFEDNYLTSCPNGCSSLLRAEYCSRMLNIRDSPGIFKYADWLPVKGTIPTRAEPICYKSSRLAEELGISNLWIVFSGYWPDKGAYATSGSFKEFEALPTIVRLRERTNGVILVSSAGNTGRAFTQVSAETGQPVIIVIPESSKERIWTTVQNNQSLLITIRGDYTDAINLGREICSLPGIYSEGGAGNVARRDGMGTVMLAGTIKIGRIPDWYVQAVGSGTGGIAAWEAGIRLRADGRFGDRLPKLCLVQNKPFIPMVRAWQAGRRNIIPEDMPNHENAIRSVYSDLLTNRTPPYGIAGGVYDTMTGTGGIMESVSTEEAISAEKNFIRCEGIDIDKAAAVCVAGLIKCVNSGIIKPGEKILLNITGGGYERVRKDYQCIAKKPDIMVTNETEKMDIFNLIRNWVDKYA